MLAAGLIDAVFLHIHAHGSQGIMTNKRHCVTTVCTPVVQPAAGDELTYSPNSVLYI